MSDGCLYFDVAKCILATLEELPMYSNYVEANRGASGLMNLLAISVRRLCSI
jgi:hypothetical protein